MIHGPHDHPTPVARLGRLLAAERGDLAVLAVYSVAIILLTLSVPLATQALVNTVAAGVFLQPVVVLGLMVFAGLTLAALLSIAQLGLVERLQQRVFARTAISLGDKILRIRASASRDVYLPELLNRFFDVLSVQKAMGKIFVDGLTAALQVLVAVPLLGVYNPSLLTVSLLALVFFVVGTLLLGIGGLRTSVRESYAKYAVAEWLEDLGRASTGLRLHADRAYVASRTDGHVMRYLTDRESHFRVVRRQVSGVLFLAAAASAGLLSAGGFLVLAGDITLGQLVAAQIVFALLLASFDKLVRQVDVFYDLLTGLDKVGHVTDLESEREGGRSLPILTEGAKVEIQGLRFGYDESRPVLDGLSLSLTCGCRVSLVGGSGAGKSTLAAILAGVEEPQGGTVEIDGVDVRAADLDSLRRVVSLVGPAAELFTGTIEENIVCGRPWVTAEDVKWAVDRADLGDDLALTPDGLATRVVSAGENLSRGQAQRVMIARAIAGRPRLLVLDEAFTGIDERQAIRVLDGLFDEAVPWTLVDISHIPSVVIRANVVHVLAEGRILESGSPRDLARNELGEFERIFPYLSRTLRQEVGA